MTIRMLLHTSRTLFLKEPVILIQFSRTFSFPFRSSPTFISFFQNPSLWTILSDVESSPVFFPWRHQLRILVHNDPTLLVVNLGESWPRHISNFEWKLTQMKRLVKYSTYLILSTLHNNPGLQSIHSIQIVFFNDFYFFFLDHEVIPQACP